jgi:hypothetical protein
VKFFYNVYLEFTSYSLSKSFLKTKIDMTFYSLECVQLYCNADLLLVMTYYMEELVMLQRCLEHFNFVSESVINAILEDTLPADLRSLDQTLPRIPPDTMVLLVIYFLQLTAHRIKNLNAFGEGGIMQ